MKTAPTGKQSARARLTWELRRLRLTGTRRRLWIVVPKRFLA